MWLPSLLTFCLISAVYSDCVVLQVDPSGPPAPAVGNLTKPAPYYQDWDSGVACPEWNNSVSCCNENANALTYANFQKLQTAFGSSTGGCDVCAANVKRFFCTFMCSPDQDKFLSWNGYKEVTVYSDTDNQPVTLNVSSVNLTLNADHACGIYQSCSKITFLTEISAGSSALGLISFLFDRGVDTSFEEVKVSVNNTGGMKFSTPPHSCNETFPNHQDDFGYEIDNACPCSFCADSCKPLDLVSYGKIQDGFNASNVILAYMFAVLLTIGCAFVKKFRKQTTLLNPNPNLQRNLLEDADQ